MKLSVDDLLRVRHVAARSVESLVGKTLNGVSTDSRTVKPGEVFVAIRGATHDGHVFVGTAFGRGAACAMVDDRSNVSQKTDRPVLVVSDTAKALGELANAYRRKFDIPVVAVAGSNGKTTTKDMIAAVLSTEYRVLSTIGNQNNQIGVPQTLFRLEPAHEIAVIEVGTNHFGEIARLCEIVDPTHGIITNIGREHLEYLIDVDGAARAEGELFAALGKRGVGFVNADDPYVVRLAKKLKKKITYGFTSARCSVRGTLAGLDSNGCATFSVAQRGKRPFTVRLSTPGNHAAANALAATVIGLKFGVPARSIQQTLSEFRGFGKRMEILHIDGVTIVNDTYNANPDSVLSALETVRAMETQGRKIVILADMLELGDASDREHERIGEAVGQMGFEFLLTYGEKAKCINEAASVKLKAHYDQKNILAEYAAELLSEGDIVLVKGSRKMTMEDVVTFLVERWRTRELSEKVL